VSSEKGVEVNMGGGRDGPVLSYKTGSVSGASQVCPSLPNRKEYEGGWGGGSDDQTNAILYVFSRKAVRNVRFITKNDYGQSEKRAFKN